MKDVDELLEPPRWGREHHERLEQAQRYFAECAKCLIAERVLIIDPLGLLARFEEVYLATRDLAEETAPKIALRIDELDEELDLCQNVIRLSALSLTEIPAKGMFYGVASALRGVKIGFGGLALSIPERGDVPIDQSLIVEIRTSLTRLAGLCGAAARAAKVWWLESQDVLVVEGFYDPRRVSQKQVARLIEQLRESITSSDAIAPDIQQRLLEELRKTTSATAEPKPPWNRILSTLTQVAMLLGGLAAFGADVEPAYKAAMRVVNYISSQALSLPQPPELPAPINSRAALPGPPPPRISPGRDEADDPF